MLSDFFQLSPLPANEMFGMYDIKLVILSYLVATFASYIALDITGRLRDVGNTKLLTALWLIGGAFVMGVGIWSMHFIGMLAFSMPHMRMDYDPLWTGVSLLVAIFASAFALFLLKPKNIHTGNLMFGGIFLGLAIASMHYIGMYAMTISVAIHYKPGLFALSIAIAIIASEAALWLAIKSNQVVMSVRFRLKLVSAIIMGAAICGMHYTGMSAAVFSPLTEIKSVSLPLNPEFLSISVAVASLCLITIAFFASTYKEAKNLQLISIARQSGMAEVASSVLHNVGNVLNSVNVSAAMIAEKIEKSKINELEKLNQLIKEHEHDLASFVIKDPRGKELANYIDMLAHYWSKERSDIMNETSILIKNIDHIKNVVNMQQDLSRVVNPEQIIAVDSILEEALMIIDLRKKLGDIDIVKHYAPVKPILIDKVKLLQILINLINNAKDSLNSSAQPHKKLDLTIVIVNGDKQLEIQVKDNGLGIPSNKLTSIFSYGFTTKKDGHGFGLHTSAIAAKEMGGNIRVKSDGENQGATFILELPYKLPKQ